MNFSNKGTQNKQQQIKSTTKRLTSKACITFFRLLLVSFVSLAIVGVFAGFGVVKSLIDKAPNIENIGLAPTRYSTSIYDKDGNLIETLAGSESNRIYVTLDQIPEHLQHAVIAIEDERFYEHDGIDVRGIFRAFFKGLSSGGDFDEGASTITQQLLKNQVFGGGMETGFLNKLERKIQEQYLAIQAEDLYTKDEILEKYLNTINLGSGTFGVQTASLRYFNKDVSELTLSEATVIAVITKSPTNYNPITGRENNEARRAECLKKMLEQGYITEKQYKKALKDNVYDRILEVNEEYKDNSAYYTYFTDELIKQVVDDLVNIKGYSATEAYNQLYSGGLKIYTTLDSEIQGIVDDVYSNPEYFPTIGVDAFYELQTYDLSIQTAEGETIHYHLNDVVSYYEDDPTFSLYFTDVEAMDKKIEAFKASVYDETKDKLLGEKYIKVIQPQSSFVIMDQKTGHVLALKGGYGDKQGNRTLNRATESTRQPGSTFKILSTYLPALDTSGMTLATVLDDAPHKYLGSNIDINNWSTRGYNGLTTLREAIYNSMNIVTVKALEKVTLQVGFDYLLKLGFTTLVDADLTYPLALGGITDGVTNLELTAAYAAIANSGTYTEPIFYTKILDHDDKVIIDNVPDTEQVMKESTAWLLTNAMEDVVKIGTGTLTRFKTLTNMPIAGKTGTTSSNYDLWFSGYTPYYTASIWSGYDNNVSQTNRSYHKVVWREIMERVHIAKGLDPVSFTMPDSIESAKICTKSGKLAADGYCDKAEGGSTVDVEYFAKGTKPTEKCDVHVKVKIDKSTGKLANEYCPEELIEEKVYLVKEETATTFDTPNLLPTETCTEHTEHSVPEEEPTEPEDEEDDINPPADTGNNDTPGINNPGSNNPGSINPPTMTPPEDLIPGTGGDATPPEDSDDSSTETPTVAPTEPPEDEEDSQ